MNAINRPLLLRSKPNADESFIGYVVRLTEQNKYDTPLWILKMARLIPEGQGHSFDFVLSDERFRSLAEFTGINISYLASITYPPSDDKFDCYLFFDNIVPRHSIRLNHPKICPKCLLES